MSVHLLLLCEYPTLNGGERSMLATFAGLSAAGFRISVAAPPDGPLADAVVSAGTELVPFSVFDAHGVRRPLESLRDELADLLLKNRPDLLHANSLSMGRLSGPVASALGTPSISHLRDILRLNARAIADLNCHTRLLAVSEATRSYHVDVGLSGKKTHVLHNGVDLKEFQPRLATGFLHRELGIPAGAMLVGSIGQLGLRKGQEVLLDAAVSLIPRFPEVHYVLVGQRCSNKEESVAFEQKLQTASETSLHGRLHLLGVRNDVAAILNELTVLAHPARQEPLGRVLLEAAASGVALIATEVGGTAEIFPPSERAALLVPPNDAAALAGALSELLLNAELRAALGSAARRRAEVAFSVETATARLIEQYRATLNMSNA